MEQFDMKKIRKILQKFVEETDWTGLKNKKVYCDVQLLDGYAIQAFINNGAIVLDTFSSETEYYAVDSLGRCKEYNCNMEAIVSGKSSAKIVELRSIYRVEDRKFDAVRNQIEPFIVMPEYTDLKEAKVFMDSSISDVYKQTSRMLISAQVKMQKKFTNTTQYLILPKLKHYNKLTQPVADILERRSSAKIIIESDCRLIAEKESKRLMSLPYNAKKEIGEDMWRRVMDKIVKTETYNEMVISYGSIKFNSEVIIPDLDEMIIFIQEVLKQDPYKYAFSYTADEIRTSIQKMIEAQQDNFGKDYSEYADGSYYLLLAIASFLFITDTTEAHFSFVRDKWELRGDYKEKDVHWRIDNSCPRGIIF